MLKTKKTKEQKKEETTEAAPSHADQLKDEMDTLLDEIDATLEENELEIVRKFVQKGGQ